MKYMEYKNKSVKVSLYVWKSLRELDASTKSKIDISLTLSINKTFYIVDNFLSVRHTFVFSVLGPHNAPIP